MPLARILRCGRAGLAAVVVLATTAALSAIPAAAAPGGSISGRVVDGDGTPLTSICVGTDETTVTTDGAGGYAILGVAAGSYAVHFFDCGFQPSPYVEQWYVGHLDRASADPVTVVEGADTPLLDVTMENGVNVGGTVVDTDGNPISDVNVWVNPTVPGLPSSGGYTAADGTYTTAALPSGSYTVQFGPTDGTHLGGWWNNRVSQQDADRLVLASADGPLHGGVDAVLPLAASLSGTVSDTDASLLSGICVEADTPNGGGGWNWLNSTSTAPDGTYTLSGLPATDIRVQFRNCSSGPYLAQWYSGTSDFSTSTAIVLSTGELRTGIDAQLSTGTQVSGTVVDDGGMPIPDVNVNVNPTGNGASAWGRTDSTGHYTTDALPAGSYVVQFQGTGGFAGEYWNDQVTRNDATPLDIAHGDGPMRAGIDATLAAGATVSGVVTGPTGHPIEGVCVDATIPSGDGVDGVGGTSTAADGTYVLSGLPAMTLKVVFRDCQGVGPYVQEWWDDQASPETATAIGLAPGDNRSGIDAQLAAAGAIGGRVTDSVGHPLQGICVQASTDTFTGGLTTTDSNGDYQLALARPGDYRVQFIDCSGSGTHAGEWWDGQADRASAQLIGVAVGQVVTGIDASLASGATGSISGRVTNVRGGPMPGVCVVAYAPFQFALAGAVAPDGTYTIPDVPSGTYALGFLGCGSVEGDGDFSPVVPDPDVPGVSYDAFWWNAVPLHLIGSSEGGPDPIAQGADLVAVTPGADLIGYDGCFGCTAITITSVTPGANSLTVAFTIADLTGGSSAGARSAAAAGLPLTSTAMCSSPSGVTGTASATGSPITVTGLTAGASYACQVTASIDGTLVASSALSGSTLVADAATDPSGELGTSTSDPLGTGSLPSTGASSPLALVRAGVVLLVVGGGVAMEGRRRTLSR